MRIMQVLKWTVLGFIGLAVIGSLIPKSEQPPPMERMRPGETWERPSADSMRVGRVRVPVSPTRVVLNFDTRRMVLEGRVPASAVSATGVVYLWAFFVNPTSKFGTGSWSDMPIRATVSGSGDTVTVRAARTPFGWSDNSEVPRSGYLAYVVAGPDSARLYLPSRYRQKDKATIPVEN